MNNVAQMNTNKHIQKVYILDTNSAESLEKFNDLLEKGWVIDNSYSPVVLNQEYVIYTLNK